MTIKYSVIIPSYNAARTLKKLLDMMERQDREDYEVLVVDDASTDQSPSLVKDYEVNYLLLKEHRGPAAIRNLGVTKTSGEWLVFADADTVFTEDTLSRIDDALQDSDADALVGTYAGTPINGGFMAGYKGLWEYATIDMPLMERGGALIPISTWALRPGVVRRSVFEAVGGFDEDFKGADLEDLELGYRISDAGYKIYFAPAVRIKRHYPENLPDELIPFARRCYLWTRMRWEKRKMDTAGESSEETARAHYFGFAAFLMILASALIGPFMKLGLLALVVYFFLIRRFLGLAWREGGSGFMLCCMPVCWLHTIVMGFAVGYALLQLKLEAKRDG